MALTWVLPGLVLRILVYPVLVCHFLERIYSTFFLMYWIIRKNYNFAFSRVTRDIFVILTLATGIVFMFSFFMAKEIQLLVSAGVTVTTAIYSVKTLICNARINMTRGFLFKIKTRFGF